MVILPAVRRRAVPVHVTIQLSEFKVEPFKSELSLTVKAALRHQVAARTSTWLEETHVPPNFHEDMWLTKWH